MSVENCKRAMLAGSERRNFSAKDGDWDPLYQSGNPFPIAYVEMSTGETVDAREYETEQCKMERRGQRSS